MAAGSSVTDLPAMLHVRGRSSELSFRRTTTDWEPMPETATANRARNGHQPSCLPDKRVQRSTAARLTPQQVGLLSGLTTTNTHFTNTHLHR